MTASDWKKAFKQLNVKPAKKAKYIKHNKPKDRKHGIATKKCSITGSHQGHISKYGINLCRHAFRQHAKDLGFKKYR